MKRQQGFTYIVVLLAVAIMGIGLLVISEVWVRTAQRNRQEQLDFVGNAYLHAIRSYYYSTPSPVKKLPDRLEDLLEDRRGAVVLRHIRQLYLNPLSSRHDWVLIRAVNGSIQGVATADGTTFSLVLH